MEMNTRDSRVAVVLITYNRSPEVLRTLGHLSALPEAPEIIVVDNGSTDGTASSIRAAFPHVEVLDAGGNLGAAARNLGIDRARAPYIALCDDDTWWEPGSLRRAADLFDAEPRLAVATAKVFVGPEQREDAICDVLARSPLPRTPEMPGVPILGFLAGASVVRRSAFLNVGGFEPRFFIGGEEELLAADLAAEGSWLCYVPELVVYHHPSERRDPHGRRWTMVRNALWFAWLRRPWPGALRTTLRLLREAPSGRVALRGLTEALYGLSWVLKERRVLPADVERGLRLLESRA